MRATVGLEAFAQRRILIIGITSSARGPLVRHHAHARAKYRAEVLSY